MLDLVIQGQSERNILSKSKKTYISKCRVMFRILNKMTEIRYDALHINPETDEPFEHTGLAEGLFKLRLPISERHVQFN